MGFVKSVERFLWRISKITHRIRSEASGMSEDALSVQANLTMIREQMEMMIPSDPIGTNLQFQSRTLTQVVRLSLQEIDVGDVDRGTNKYYRVTCKGRCKNMEVEIDPSSGDPDLVIT